MAELMSQRAYARHRNVTHRAVQKAIESGRIAGAIEGGKINAYVADRLWADNTDESKPSNSVSGNPRHRRPDDSPPVPGAGAASNMEGGGAAGGGTAYTKARAVRETYAAKLARLEYEQKSGELVRRDEVKTSAFNAARKARDMLMTIPDRVAATLAATDDQGECHRILSEEIRRVCEELSNVGGQ